MSTSRPQKTFDDTPDGRFGVAIQHLQRAIREYHLSLVGGDGEDLWGARYRNLPTDNDAYQDRFANKACHTLLVRLGGYTFTCGARFPQRHPYITTASLDDFSPQWESRDCSWPESGSSLTSTTLFASNGITSWPVTRRTASHQATYTPWILY